VIFDNNLAKAEAKFLEQKIMDLNGGALSTKQQSRKALPPGTITDMII